ncbi:MAG: hypothetical protein WD851_10465 [Pirellulales bacterium]
MELLHSSEHPESSTGTICRQSSAAKLALLLIVAAIPCGLTVAWWAGHFPTLLFVPIGGLMALIVPLLIGDWRATLEPTNWILRIGDRHLLLNLRTYSNRRFEDALTVVRIEYPEIDAVRKHVAKHAAPGSDNEERWSEKSLDLVFKTAVPKEVVAALREENRRKNPGRRFLGITVSGGEKRSPVTIPAANVLRVSWTGKHSWVTPRLGRVLSMLDGFVAVGEETREDQTDWRTMSDLQFDELVLDMVQRGDRMTAGKLLQERRGYSLTQAKQFVDELASCA